MRGLWVTNGTAAGTHELVSSLFGGVEALGVLIVAVLIALAARIAHFAATDTKRGEPHAGCLRMLHDLLN